MLIWGLSALSVLLLLIAFVIYRNYKEKKRLNGVLEEKNVALDKEQAVSNGLLLNILPAPIALRLKQGEKVIVDMFKNTTVMFIDLAGFTKLSSRTKPDQLVAMLNSIFSELDTLSEKYGVEKIKTIGDAYMVASGIPNTRADHAEAAARMALEAQRIVAKLRTPDGSPIEVRIGLASGEAIAGVIGTKKYIYDLWGDTVNTAARMESTGETGKIQCTQSVYDILKATFTFQKRGEIEVKGKGTMTTYFLTGSV
ncbi:MAG: adenylate/guanylate cyclase domain-containing protein [Candidatus Kapabacteria bacterium]|nr:adenylate/guanylate cyclase domain-containing protein [Candidatus Kapabacteria bacterium]